MQFINPHSGILMDADTNEVVLVEDCGSGAGGFKPGNTCGKGKGSGTGRKTKLSALKELRAGRKTERIIKGRGKTGLPRVKDTTATLHATGSSGGFMKTRQTARRAESKLTKPKLTTAKAAISHGLKPVPKLLGKDVGNRQISIFGQLGPSQVKKAGIKVKPVGQNIGAAKVGKGKKLKGLGRLKMTAKKAKRLEKTFDKHFDDMSKEL